VVQDPPLGRFQALESVDKFEYKENYFSITSSVGKALGSCQQCDVVTTRGSPKLSSTVARLRVGGGGKLNYILLLLG
jgi:hypothetical protein